MPATIEELGIDKWSLKDRIGLIEELNESVRSEEQFSGVVLSDPMKRLIEERIAAADADPEGGRPWREVMDRVFGKR